MKIKSNHTSIMFIVCTLCLVVAVPAWSATYYVNAGIGNDNNIGTVDSPWGTIEYAVSRLANGDLLMVAPGTYIPIDSVGDASAVDVIQNQVTIEGAAGVVIDGNNQGWQYGFNITGSNVVLKNLEITRFSDDGTTAVNVSGSNNRIESCSINSSDYGIVFVLDSGSGNSVIDSLIHNNDHGVIVSGASPEIRRNSIYENRAAIEVTNYSGTIRPKIINNLIYGFIDMEYGIWISAFSTGATVAAEIYHNTLFGCSTTGIYISQEFPDLGESIPVKFNIISYSLTGIEIEGEASTILDLDYNDFYGNDLSYGIGATPGANDVDINPTFVDTLNYNFHLQATSPIIDYIDGVVSDPVLVDRDGGVRPIGAGKEPGCYEFRAATETIALPLIEAGRNINDFKMISIVHLPDNPDPQAVFNINYNPNNHRIGTWSPEQGRYIEFGQGLTMEPGRAYWILARNGLTVNFKGVPVSMDDYAEVCLYCNDATGKGWNMIAPPNAANYRWNEVLVGRWLGDDHPDNVEPVPVTYSAASDLINHRIYEWKNGKYVDHRLDEDFVLEFYKGYWVKAIVDGVYLEFHESARVAGLSTPMNTMLAWKGKAIKWMKRLLPSPREAMADNDLPPVPMESFDGSTNPLFEGCFVQTISQ